MTGTQLALPLAISQETLPKIPQEMTPETRPWIWRYCKLNPDADHESDRPDRAGMKYDCCCPQGHCLTGFAPAWLPAPGGNGRKT